MNFATVWEALADAMGERSAFVQGTRRLSWRAFDEQASRVAGALASAGVREGDRVALVARNNIELFVVIFAAFKLRAVPVAFNYRYLADEMHEVLSDSDAVAVFFDGGLEPTLRSIRDTLPNVRSWIELSGPTRAADWAAPFAALLDTDPLARTVRSADDQFIVYTGGTTGRPKGVVWRHQDVANTVAFIAYMPLGLDPPTGIDAIVAVARDQVENATAPVYLVSAPLMHGAGIYGACGSLQIAGTVVLLEDPGFDPDEFLTAIQQERVTSTVIVGDVFAHPIVDALDGAAERGAPYDLSSLVMLTSSGVAFSAALKRRFLAHAPTTTVMEAIGCSEGGPYATSITFPGMEPDDTATFTAGPLTVLVDESDTIVPWGTDGDFRVGYCGPLPHGYFKDEAKTASTFLTIGDTRYLVPGDYVRIAADGRLTFLGRGNTCINTGGEKVYPQEVEEVLKGHDAVQDCVVVGVPDQRYGSAVAAVVSLVPGRTLSTAEAASHVKRHLAGYKQPRHLVVVDEVRRSAAGKADYRWALDVARG